jgi:DNA-binding transcriptional LysR family regulator
MLRVDRLETMRVFVAVAQAEGFAPAARRLRMSAPAVTRAIAALERRLGAQLLLRTSRVVRLTEAGRRFLVDCQRIFKDLEDAESSAASTRDQLNGQISVTAPRLFGKRHVSPLLLEFLRVHPQLNLRLLLLDRVTDMLEEDIDVAVRIAHLPDSLLRAVRVGSVRRVVCAAPAFLEVHGRPKSRADLAKLASIAVAIDAQTPLWPLDRDATSKEPRPTARMLVNSPEIAVMAAVAGHGVVSVLSYQVAAELASGQLELLAFGQETPVIPVHVVHTQARRSLAKVHALVDFMVQRLRLDPVLRSRS